MKKLALSLLGIGSLLAVSVSAANYSPAQPEPQYQEQCQPATNCYSDTCYNLPCNVPVNQTAQTPVPCTPAPCAPDTVCNPAPCNPAPCNPAPCNPGC